MKADKMDLERLFEIKSNKTDTDGILTCQTIMYQQFKHILSLFIEIVNIQTCKANDTKQSYENRGSVII